MALTKGVGPRAEGAAMKVLVVDDEVAILEAVTNRFRREGFTTFTAETAEEGMRLFRHVKPDLVIVDAMLPQRTGIEFCRAMKKNGSSPTLFLATRAEEVERVRALELGADAYVVKPFNLADLATRAKALVKRQSPEPAREVVEQGNLRLDPRTRETFIDGQAVSLSPKEFGLLYFLCRHVGQVFSREELLDRVWGRDAFVSARTVDVHVRWLRVRIEPDSNSPTRILTVRGAGYKLVG